MLLTIVFTTGLWWSAAGYSVSAIALLGGSAWLLPTAGVLFQEFGAFLWSLEPLESWWLLLLLLIPVMIWWSYPKLAGLGPARRIMSVTLRSLLVILVALALSETHARQLDRNLTVIFLWDRSLSIPPEPVRDFDAREKRVFGFINDAVAHRGPEHNDDRAGVIVFGRRPRLELPPGKVPQLNFRKILSQVDNTYTDIGGAIKLALATFPEGTAKRIVLI